ncbi:MAG: LuxR C-terminal-related transcriptional regulator [Ilumatobacteraceae bacterium]
MNVALPHPVNRPLLARLDREWRVLNERPAVLRRARSWGLGIELRSLEEVVAATGYWANRGQRLAGEGVAPAVLPAPATASATTPARSANEVLRRLLLAARADDVAARVVLQRLLPGLIARARVWGGRRPGGSVDAFDELLSAAWTVIREYPVERRPSHLAANLLRDSEYRAFQRARRRLLVHELTDPNLLDLPVEVATCIDVAEELAEVVALARSLTQADLRLIELLVQGRTAREVAASMSVSERTVRNHRDAVVHRLRAAAMAA